MIGGVRVERTESDFTAFDVEFVDGDIDPAPPQSCGPKSYTNWLPGLQMRMPCTATCIVRAAWTNTIGRPVLRVERAVPPLRHRGSRRRAGRVRRRDRDGQFRPRSARVHEPRPLGRVVPAAVRACSRRGIFYKDIDNPIFTRLQQLEDVDFEGRFYSELDIVQPQNADSGEILGMELNYQQAFSMLPAPFDGLGMALDYSYSDSEATVFDRDSKVPFFLQSEHVANLALFYERSGLGLRLAYSYRSEYLDALGDVAGDRPLRGRHTVSSTSRPATTSARRSPCSCSCQNITDEPLRS